jgi:hypothetical protein
MYRTIRSPESGTGAALIGEPIPWPSATGLSSIAFSSLYLPAHMEFYVIVSPHIKLPSRLYGNAEQNLKV